MLVFFAKATYAQTEDEYKTVVHNKSYENAQFEITEFDSTLFLESVSFDSAVFLDTAHFEHSQFSQNASFKSAVFKGVTLFLGSKFEDDVSFRSATFGSILAFVFMPDVEGVLDFSRARFHQSISIGDATNFRKQVYFNGAEFEGPAYIDGNTFHGNVSFLRATFEAEVSISNSFKAFADFTGTVFDSTVRFSGRFDKNASFKQASFGGKVSFDRVVLPDTLYFSDIRQIEEEIDLTYATLDSSRQVCVIDLYGTDISKLRLDYAHFQIIRGTDYPKNHISHVYEQILKMQRDMGFLDGYEKADKEYQHFKLTYEKQGLKHLWGSIINCLRFIWWDYGYEKGRIVLIIFVSVLFFTTINAFCFPTMNEKVYEIENIYQKWKKESGLAISDQAVAGIRILKWKTLIASLFYTSFIFFGLRLSAERIKFKHEFKYSLWSIYLLFQYGFGLICLAFLANYIIAS